MIRLLVCSSRSFALAGLVEKTLDNFSAEYDGVVINAWGTEGAGKIAHRWAKKNLALYDELVLFQHSCDLVVAFGSGGSIPLRQAWKKRIPALRVEEDGRHVRIGVGWKLLLQRRRKRVAR